MNLHHDYEAFSEFIIAASNELHIPPRIIEKDYSVTLALKELVSRVNGMVFKGGYFIHIVLMIFCFKPRRNP